MSNVPLMPMATAVWLDASHGLTDREMKWQSPMAFSDVKMTGVTKMSIFVHDDPGYAYR